MSDRTVVEPAQGRLTAREREVLELLAAGLRQDEIGTQLGIGAETVRSHLRNASGRLGGVNATQTVAIAIRQGLIAF